MKGKENFSQEEIDTICTLIEQKLNAPSYQQKAIRDKIRGLGFYGGEDFGLRNYNVEDFLRVINKNRTTLTTDFTWVPVHKKIVKWLQARQSNQDEILQLLKGLGITGFKDMDSSDHETELSEIDPFTFFCYLYKHGSEKRLELLKELCRRIGIDPTPSDDHGIPSANAQKVWLFPWKFKRTNNEIERLWTFFNEAISFSLGNSRFQDVRAIKNAGKVKLTEGLFYIDPERYLPINSQVKPYLEAVLHIDPSFDTFDEYLLILEDVKKATQDPFYKISYDAWLWNNNQAGTDGSNSASINNYVMSTPLNQIFYGPPGTGKTYHTISEAVKITDPNFYKEHSGNRQKLKERFRQLLIKDWKGTQGQIAFCTFHQAFSYEDFVEGIKPEVTEDRRVIYAISDGIFKRICRLSSDSKKSAEIKEERVLSWDEDTFRRASFYKISLGDVNNAEEDAVYDYCVDHSCIAVGFGEGYDFSGLNEEEVIAKGKELKLKDYDISVLNRFINYLQIGNYVIVSKGNRYVRAIAKVTGDYQFDPDAPVGYNNIRRVEWIIKNESIPIENVYDRNLVQKTIYKISEAGIKKDFFVRTGSLVQPEIVEKKKYVIIIDEINRGNVSAIFGELITLIEKDKRSNGDLDSEEIEVTLPYSKESFKVPDNVYIIGTMNTADRSIEALDTALRRRFSFREIGSDPNLIGTKGPLKYGKIGKIDVVSMLATINQRINKLLDKDHEIGHAYFLDVVNEDALRQTFEDKVIPLLQEYFFGDFGKIGLVLGSSFVEKIGADDFSFAKFDGYDSSIASDLKERPLFRITSPDKWDFNSIYA